MTKVIKMTESEIKNFITTYKAFETMPTNAYIAHFFQGDGFSVSIYKSGKVVFQGSKLDYFKEYVNDESSDSEGNYPYNHMDTIGSDEVGTGDLFGPIVVATCLVKGKDTNELLKLGVKDSKKITDKEIVKIGKTLVKKLKHKVIILRNEQYNNNTSIHNINELKAGLHNSNIRDLAKEVKYDVVCLDDFCGKTNYFKYLNNIFNIKPQEVFSNISFETKGETKSIAVAAASIIARCYFLKEMDNLEKLYGYKLPKGAGSEADELIKQIKKDGKEDILYHITKLNFKNLKK